MMEPESPYKDMIRIVVIASGRGSNFQAIIDAIRDHRLNAVIVRLITDNPSALAVSRADLAGIPVRIIDYTTYPSREDYESELYQEMVLTRADLFVLAGYMRILGRRIVEGFPGQIINIHPALLPSFPGLHAQEQALAYGVKVAGCTVHFVTQEMDSGPIITQRCVPVMAGDDPGQLSQRILEQEHICLVEAIRFISEDRVTVQGRCVTIR